MRKEYDFLKLKGRKNPHQKKLHAQKKLRTLKGKVVWEGDLEKMRTDSESDHDKLSDGRG